MRPPQQTARHCPALINTPQRSEGAWDTRGPLLPSERDIVILGRWRRQFLERIQLFRHLVFCLVVSCDNQRTDFKQPRGNPLEKGFPLVAGAARRSPGDCVQESEQRRPGGFKVIPAISLVAIRRQGPHKGVLAENGPALARLAECPRGEMP